MKRLLNALCIAAAVILTAILPAFTVACGDSPLPENEGDFYELEHFDYYEHWVRADDGKNIYGRIYAPKGFELGDEYPVVIMSHGFTSTFRVWNSYIKPFTDAGFVCYAFDFCGGSVRSSSDGRFTDMSAMTEASDLKHVVADIKTEKYVKCERLYLMGESMGGLVSAIVAPAVADDIDGLALMYPAFNIPDDVRAKYPDRDKIPDEPKMLLANVGKRYVTDIYDLDAYAEASKYRGDVVIYHGDGDNTVKLDYSKKAVEHYGGNAKLTVVENATHGFNSWQAEKTAKAIAERWQNA